MKNKPGFRLWFFFSGKFLFEIHVVQVLEFLGALKSFLKEREGDNFLREGVTNTMDEKEFLIESSHTPEECLQALDEVMEESPEILSEFRWACKSGDHRGWVFVEADSEEEALDILPESLRSKAKAIEVAEFTEEELRAAHEQV